VGDILRWKRLRSFEKFLSIGAEAAGAHTVPNNDEADGDGKDQTGDRIDCWSDAATQAAPDF